MLETGPRSCIFRVAGVIVLERALLVDGPAAANLSILGQTAPGGGITLTVSPDSENLYRTPLVIRRTSDVVVRHLRLRSRFANSVRNVDAVTVEASRRVYLDHVSGSWATDENFNTHGQTSELTVAYSIFGEGLRKHSKCALIGSDPSAPQSISFWRNLCISNNDRNPDVNHFQKSCVEITDNLFYNARSEWMEVFSQFPGGTTTSVVGNYFKAGPSTLVATFALKWQDVESAAQPQIYMSDNAVWSPLGKTIGMVAQDTARVLVAEPACPLESPTFADPARTYGEVLAYAGAFPRDTVDARFVKEVGALGSPGSGKLRNRAGDLDVEVPATPYADRDLDGMADSVETRMGANPAIFDAWDGVDDDGWSSFDRFMQWLSQERLANRYPE
ncbi:hypothetical protein [Aureimonas sp. SA4125]|uniref:hypothetical protein n=1 Tax=Aureimonas sp. SA4125 TaxID=2826993 RepID=UPI001CC554F0|nr:hypothetical protein [Aureimonas sp. SA4125]